MWVCALSEAHTVSHLSRGSGTFATGSYFDYYNALLHRWMSAGDGSSAGVCASPEAQSVPHASRWAAVHLLSVFF